MPVGFSAVADASSLIVLAKVNALETLYAVYGVVAITDTVFRETVLVGQQLGKIDGKVSCAQCLELMERIAIAMGTDVAVLSGMKAAVEALESERQENKRDV